MSDEGKLPLVSSKEMDELREEVRVRAREERPWRLEALDRILATVLSSRAIRAMHGGQGTKRDQVAAWILDRISSATSIAKASGIQRAADRSTPTN
jgi:hypothetical protein